MSETNIPRHSQRNAKDKIKETLFRDFGLDSNRYTPAGISTDRDDIDNDSRYHIKFLVGTLIRSCYGCGQPIRLPPHVPPPPYDIVICQKEYRTYTNKEGQLKLTLQPQNVHYHCRSQCMLRKHEDFDKNVRSPNSVTPNLTALHRYYIMDYQY
jgi:hypothetical protein